VDKARLAALIVEKRRREADKRPEYVPNAGQLPVHLCTKHDRWVFSANGSGKTTLLVHEIRAAATGHNPWLGTTSKIPVKIGLVVDNARKIEEVVVPEYRKWFEWHDSWATKEGKPYISKIRFPNGSTISVYSTESDPMLFEGVQFDYVFVDEPLPYLLYVALKRSLRIKGSPSRFLFCGTPISQPWMKTMIWDQWTKGDLPTVECFKVGVEVNTQNLDQGFLDRFQSTLTEVEKETRLRGGFFHAEGMALAHLWDRPRHVVPPFEWDPSWPVVLGIDPHPVKKHIAVLLGAHPDGGLYAIKELALKAPASQFAEALKKWLGPVRPVDIVVDSLGATEGTSFEGYKSFIEVLNESGVRCRSTRFVEKSHEDLIDRMQSGLVVPPDGEPTLRVFSSCRGLIQDIETVGWQRNKNTGEYAAKLATGSKDFLSALGYALACGLTYDRPRRSKPHLLARPPYRGLETPSQRRIKRMVAIRRR